MTKHLIKHEIEKNFLLVIIKGMEMLLKANFSTENKMGIREIISSLKEMVRIQYQVYHKPGQGEGDHEHL